MKKSSQSEKLKKLILIRERLRPLSAQLLKEVVGGELITGGGEELTLVHPRT